MGEHILNNPEALAKVQQQLTEKFVPEKLPKSVRRRVDALRALQLKALHLEVEFNKELCVLEHKYNKLVEKYDKERSDIINGLKEPNEEELNAISEQYPGFFDYDEDSDEESRVVEELDEEGKAVVKEEENEGEDVKGVPDFWFTFLLCLGKVSEQLQEKDESILRHLTDIRTALTDDPMEFILEFHFSPNDYFENSVLTKRYKLKCEIDKENPFSFDGPEVAEVHGCTINWKPGKNPGVQNVQKMQRNNRTGSLRAVTKQVVTDSFFNFFNELDATDDSPEAEELKQSDFELALCIRERLRQAVLYFTGEALEDDEFDEDDEDEDEDEDEESSDDEKSPPKQRGGGAAARGKNKRPDECQPQ